MKVSTKTLKIKNISEVASFNSGETLLDILNAANISIPQSCGGNGSCTTCRVFILTGSGGCSVRTDIEVDHTASRDFLDNERLACQTCCFEDLELEIPEEL